ncbi:MAG: trigger factor [Chlorobium sp.]|uniref:trigger factor n=1 Tax=Chlorobium sp. TaxID=1095 RepID=UPI0025C608BD|nr:trigger factor [Chlorobium sp.]MCF8215302.1 trigger factor [Chlorobium sp.]MCF8270139.1 trigger factor [Chlorobium sp.]MCF8286509.1 trigger factor [Chlorobium sp.]MCF8290107.1 trigger factor [Chlorobium sp.]MCF8384179.1 trigger factor [Chlorobium sp.]
MQKNITQINETEQQLEIILSAEEYGTEYNQELEEAKRTVQIKGFRKGHVPAGMIKKLIGPSIEASIAEKMASRHFAAIAEENKIKTAGRASIDGFSFDDDQLKIQLSYEIHPEFELKSFEDYSFTQPHYTITDEDVRNEINLILKGHGTLISVDEAATENDTIIGDVSKLDDAGEAEEGSTMENHHFNLEYLPEDNPFRKALIGKKAGENADVDTEPKDDATPVQHYRIAVKEVKRLELPELTDELVKEISGQRFETASDFTADVRIQLEQHFTMKSEEELLESISSKLIEENPVPAPKSMIASFSNMLVENAKRQMGGNFPKGFDSNQFALSLAPNAEKHARWLLISQKIAEMNSLTVTDDDIRAFAEKEAEKNPSISVEQAMNAYMSDEFRDYISDSILKDKVYEIIRSQVTITEEPTPIPAHKA